MAYVVVVWLSWMLFTPPCPAQEPAPPELPGLVDRLRAEAGIPGCVVLIAHGDGTQQVLPSGLAGIEDNAPAVADTLFRAGSITKTFIAVLTLKLAEEGYFGLDDPAAKYVPASNYWLSLSQAPERVTIRQLLQHTSGIPDPFVQLGNISPQLLNLLDSEGQLQTSLPQFAGAGEPFAPGEGCCYSNSGYLLLGLVLETATKRELAGLLREYILTPLKLDHTYYAATESTPPQAEGYTLVDGEPRRVTQLDRADLAGPAGALLTDADDLARFARALFAGRLLTEQQLRAMEQWRAIEGGGEYGLGVYRSDLGGREALGHNGITEGYRCELWYLPATGAVAVALSNCGSESMARSLGEVLDAAGL